MTVIEESGLLTSVQLRTVRDLRRRAGAGWRGARRPPLGPASRASCASLGMKGAAEPLWLSKSALTSLERCEGLFDAGMNREGPPFEHSENTAAGALFHKAIEVDIGGHQEFDLRLVGRAGGEPSERRRRRFRRVLGRAGRADRLELLAEAARRTELFRASLPPLGRGGAALPMSELKVRAEVAGRRRCPVGQGRPPDDAARSVAAEGRRFAWRWT